MTKEGSTELKVDASGMFPEALVDFKDNCYFPFPVKKDEQEDYGG